MATRPREGAGGGDGGGRGRKGNSSSNPPPQPQPQPPKKAAPRPSPSQRSSPSSQKPLPGYLRPTISSSSSASLDFSSSRASRRSSFDTSASTATKPSLDRRRSNNKPPSPAPATKNLRPASAIATRTPPSVKPPPQRVSSTLSSRSTKAPAGSYMRSYSAKVSPSNSGNSLNKFARKAGPRSVTSESSVEFEARDKDPLDHVIGGEDDTRSDSDQHEAQSLPEISEMPDQEEKLGDPEMVVQEAVEAKNENDVAPQGPNKAVAEEVEQEQETEGNENDQATEAHGPSKPVAEEVKQEQEAEGNEDNQATEAQGPSKPVAEEVEQEQETEGNEDDQATEPSVAEESRDKGTEEIVETAEHVNQGEGAEENATKEDSTKVDEKHVVVELEASTEGSKEGGEETSAATVQVKIESPPPVKAERPAKQTQPGKKGTQAYNDVIEETASKLIKENNRSKVRALAGAFDKVISLQDTAK